MGTSKAITDAASSPSKVLARLAFPLLIMGLLDYVGGVVGLAWVGKYVGVEGLAVMSIWHPASLILFWAVLIVPKGATSLLARAVARGDGSAPQMLRSALATQLVIVISLTLGLLLFLSQIATMLTGDHESLRSDLFDYSLWYTLALPMWGIANVLLSVFYATGNTRAALYRSLASLIFLFAAIPFCILVFKLGVISPVVAALAFVCILVVALAKITMRLDLGPTEESEKFRDTSYWKQILAIGAPGQLARILGFFVLGIYVALAASDSLASAAAFGLMFRLGVFMGKSAMALSQATGIATGQNIGASQTERALVFAKLGVLYSFLLGALFFVGCFFAEPVVRIFTSDDIVVARTVDALSIVRWGFLVNGCVQVLFALFEAVGKTGRSSLLVIAADILGVSVAILIERDGLTSATLGVTVSMAFRFVLLAMLSQSRIIRPMRESAV